MHTHKGEAFITALDLCVLNNFLFAALWLRDSFNFETRLINCVYYVMGKIAFYCYYESL